MIFTDMKRSFEEIRLEISGVRWAGLSFGNAIRFFFRGKAHMGFLRGRNFNLFVGIGEEGDGKVAARTVIDGDAYPSKGKMKMLQRYADQHCCCAICSRPISITEATRDHVVPKSKGGGRDWDNIRICCRSCNMGKGDK